MLAPPPPAPVVIPEPRILDITIGTPTTLTTPQTTTNINTDSVADSRTTDPDTPITGQFDLGAVGPNQLVAIGSGADGVLRVWPITVDLAAIPEPATIALLGLGVLPWLTRRWLSLAIEPLMEELSDNAAPDKSMT